MEYRDLVKLTDDLKAALKIEWDTKLQLVFLKAQTAQSAREQGFIDGKNAPAREEQLTLRLSIPKIVTCEREAAECSAEVERLRKLIALTGAWLYSQAPDRD